MTCAFRESAGHQRRQPISKQRNAHLQTTLVEVAQIAPGETTPDGKVSLLTARCLGSCGLAPAVVFDGEVLGKVEPGQMQQRIARWMSHDA